MKGVRMFKFGVNTFIWSEFFTEKDVPLIEKAKSLGFEVIDIGIMDPEKFPTKQVKEKIKEVGIEVVAMTVLPENANIIDPNPEIKIGRAHV